MKISTLYLTRYIPLTDSQTNRRNRQPDSRERLSNSILYGKLGIRNQKKVTDCTKIKRIINTLEISKRPFKDFNVHGAAIVIFMSLKTESCAGWFNIVVLTDNLARSGTL